MVDKKLLAKNVFHFILYFIVGNVAMLFISALFKVKFLFYLSLILVPVILGLKLILDGEIMPTKEKKVMSPPIPDAPVLGGLNTKQTIVDVQQKVTTIAEPKPIEKSPIEQLKYEIKLLDDKKEKMVGEFNDYKTTIEEQLADIELKKKEIKEKIFALI